MKSTTCSLSTRDFGDRADFCPVGRSDERSEHKRNSAYSCRNNEIHYKQTGGELHVTMLVPVNSIDGLRRLTRPKSGRSFPSVTLRPFKAQGAEMICEAFLKALDSAFSWPIITAIMMPPVRSEVMEVSEFLGNGGVSRVHHSRMDTFEVSTWSSRECLTSRSHILGCL